MPLEAGRRFCTNCGATTSIDSDARTALTSDQTVGSDQLQDAWPQCSQEMTALEHLRLLHQMRILMRLQ
jgi:hypothetical protein